MKRFSLFALGSLLLFTGKAQADKVIMKDGTVYKGKIQIDTDKAVLIGNPPFDPNSYLLESKDIQTIVYEQYHQSPPAERRRGLLLETRMSGNIFSSSDLSLHPAPGLYLGGGFRIHPMFEIDGGVESLPAVSAKSGLGVTDPTTSRVYKRFYMYSGIVSGKIYPFFKNQKLSLEPFLVAGYRWTKLVPKASGDTLKGSGWHLGFGAMRPLTRHIFLEAQFLYERLTFDSIDFLGQQGNIRPVIIDNVYSLNLGASYRF